ncbi:Gmad2 immunoglobulin-like domain-containing protein [Henriciella aquimarina]|uniref:Gmad2 immunoglobulin-like domain-containing protein n=1 Tax=Henriciella aquimarina TaxID=545261 RepID=UPI000A051602|nr:Gmad2 immunoglobulin-like domain-containing protein [Henriciella aquimarina]
MLRLTTLLTSALMIAACNPGEEATAPADTPPAMSADLPQEMTIDTPDAGAEVTSPIHLSGKVPGTWYFEGQFEVDLVTKDGTVLTEHYAEADGSWMTEEPVRFTAEIAYTVDTETPAMLVLREEDPSGRSDRREAQFPVILAPDT